MSKNEWYDFITAEESSRRCASARYVEALTDDDKHSLAEIKETIEREISNGETCCKCKPILMTDNVWSFLSYKGYSIRYIGGDIFIDWSGKYENLI